MKNKIVPATVLLDSFNDCPGANPARAMLARLGVEFGNIDVVDCPEKTYWSNAYDTLVFVLELGFGREKRNQAFVAGLRFSDSLIHSDELDHLVLADGQILFRLWWD